MLGHSYLYVVGVSNEGKRVLAGPYEDKIEAANAEDDLHEAKTFTLKTRDRNKAARIIKEKFRKSGEDVDSALKRVKHQEPTGFVDGVMSRITGSKEDEDEESIFEGDPFK